MATIAKLYSFGDLVGFAQDELNDDDNSLQDKIKRWLNRYQLKLNYTRHPIFDLSSGFNTVASKHLYTLSGTTTIVSAAISAGNVLAVRFLARPKSGNWDRLMLRQKDISWMRAIMPDPTDVSDFLGAPEFFAPFGLTSAMNPKFYLYPVPDAAAAMKYVFTQRLSPLSAAADNNVLTLNWGELLVKAAVYEGWKSKKDYEAAAITRGEFMELMREFWSQTEGESEQEGFRESIPAPSVQGVYDPLGRDI